MNTGEPKTQAAPGQSETRVEPSRHDPAILDAVVARTKVDPAEARRQRILADFQQLLATQPEEAAVPHIGPLAVISAQIRRLDEQLSAGVNQILHDPAFQRLEASWTGLDDVLQKARAVATKTGKTVEVYVLSTTKHDLAEDFARHPDMVGTNLFTEVYSKHYDNPTSYPFSLLVVDLAFGLPVADDPAGPSPLPDVKVLGKLSEIAKAAFTVAVTAAQPELVGCDSFARINDRRNLDELYETREFREYIQLAQIDTKQAQHLGIVVPPVLGRLPWGKENPAKDFPFEETIGSHDDYLWVNPAYAVARLVVGAFEKNDLCSMFTGEISRGGLLDPTFIHKGGLRDDEAVGVGPLEVGIRYSREEDLVKHGIIPLIEKTVGGVTEVVLRKTPSFQTPVNPNPDPGTTNSDELQDALRDQLHCDLKFTILRSRVAHEVHATMQRLPGEIVDAELIAEILNRQISRFKGTPKESLPLKDAKIEVEPVAGRKGYYDISITLVPHDIFEGANVTITLEGERAGGAGDGAEGAGGD